MRALTRRKYRRSARALICFLSRRQRCVQHRFRTPQHPTDRRDGNETVMIPRHQQDAHARRRERKGPVERTRLVEEERWCVVMAQKRTIRGAGAPYGITVQQRDRTGWPRIDETNRCHSLLPPHFLLFCRCDYPLTNCSARDSPRAVQDTRLYRKRPRSRVARPNGASMRCPSWR